MATPKGFFKAVLLTGLLAGTLDATCASIQYVIMRSQNPAKVFRYIASGVFGKEALTKDLYTMAAWGLLFHYIIAMSFTLFFFLFFRQIRSIFRNKWAAGIAYALLVWCVMNLVVVPLTFGVPPKPKFPNAPIAAGILIIAIGLPISLMADRFYKKSEMRD